MTIDKRISYRRGSDIPDRGRGKIGSRNRSSAPTRSSPSFSSGMGRQQYSATQTQTGAVKGGGPRGPDNRFTTSFVGGDRGRDSRDEFIRNVQKTNPGYTPGPPRNNFFNRTIGAGLDYARRNPQNIALGLIDPSFGALSGIFSFLNSPEMRKKLTGYETQAEYEQARQDRINLNRIKTLENTIQKKYLDKGRSLTETDLDERLAGLKSQMGITPNTTADLRPDLDFSNEAELAFEGVGSLPVPSSTYDMAGVNDFTVPSSTYDMAGVNDFIVPSSTYDMAGVNQGLESIRVGPEDTGFIEVLDTPQSEDNFFLNAISDATTFPTDDGSGISLMKRSILRNAGYNDSQIREAQEDGYLDQLVRDIEGPIGIT